MNEELTLLTDNEVTPETQESLIDETNKDAFKFLSIKSQMNDINRLADDIKKKTLEYIDTEDEAGKFLDEVAMSKSIDELKALSDEEINGIYNNSDNPITLNIDFGGDAAKEISFKREFLIFRHQSLEAIQRFDEEMERLNKEIAESQAEFDAACNEFGNVTNLIRSTIKKNIENAKNDHTKEVYTNIQKYFEYGFSLDNLKEYIASYRGKDIIGDYRNEKKTMYVYRTYKKVAASFNIKTNLGDNIFANIEHRFLDAEISKEVRPNIFMFAVMHYIASWNNKNIDKARGLFITQFTINMKNLIYNKFDDESERDAFIKNISDVIACIR